ncbi:MAG TPA: hypothetical protein VM223_02415 [Planctomycetota bacterium]|nr:hypothetical protein [Planctomycetota bacterium]
MRTFSLLALGIVLMCSTAFGEVVLEQVISREHPHFDCAQSRLVVGRDGLLYFPRSYKPGGYLLRMARDGSSKTGGPIQYSNNGVAVNADGTFIVAECHFAHTAAVYDRNFDRIGAVTDFNNANYDAPCHVEVGASGDFYAVDQRADRIVRISPAGKMVTAYAIPRDQNPITDFRVCEKTQSFYVRPYARPMRCVGFDGQDRFTPQTGPIGGWDVDDDGVLYIIEPRGEAVKRFAPDGQPMDPIKLNMGDLQPPNLPGVPLLNHLRVAGNDVFLKRPSPTELFQRYDLATGNPVNAVSIDHEKLTVAFDGDVWTAGQPVPFRIEFTAGGRTIKPQWRVWLRPFNVPGFAELSLANGAITPPADAAGLYQLRVTTGVDGSASEYVVQTFVEIRHPDTNGSATVLTPAGRMYYGRGEEIPVTVALRTDDAVCPVEVTLRLLDGKTVIAEGKLTVTPDRTATTKLSETLTAGLRPGAYELAVVDAPGLTCVPQRIVIGPGFAPGRRFFRIQYGDYGAQFPGGTLWDAPENVARHLRRTAKLGTNMFVDRLGHSGAGNIGAFQWQNNNNEIGLVNSLFERLTKDPLAVAPEKVRIETPLLQTLAGYSAAGLNEMSILLYMDAGLPIGTSYDARTREQYEADITKVTNSMLPYPCFRGWTWAANWWVGKFGADAARDDQQKAACNDALKAANETGRWNPVIDEVSSIWMNHAVEGEQFYDGILQKVAPGKLSVMTGAYRNVSVYPPVTFANADEVDLHYQAEQIQPPNTVSHNVDFQSRPGKPAWGHPELWNDSGTGGQILPSLFMMVMRGVGGIGTSGGIPNWGRQREDARNPYYGIPSVFRAAFSLIEQYGPWLLTLQNNDKVAILASDRMFRIDNWGGIGGRHFTRIFEAYQSCLYAHHPASIIFAEDLKPDTLKRYKAILLVDERVELQGPLMSKLADARKAGVAIFYDQTCRKELFPEFAPLDLGFTNVDSDPHVWQDDSAYWRFPGYFRANAAVLRKAFDPIMTPVADAANPEVLFSERINGDGRFIFAVNYTAPTEFEPGQLWRVTLGMTTRVPVRLLVTLADIQGKAVYDIFALKQVKFALNKVRLQDGAVDADLRILPMRVFAVLPKPIAAIRLNGPRPLSGRITAPGGSTLEWAVSVLDNDSNPIRASVPVHVRLVSPDGSVVQHAERSAGQPAGR